MQKKKMAEASPTYVTGEQIRVGKTPIGLKASGFFSMPNKVRLL